MSGCSRTSVSAKITQTRCVWRTPICTMLHFVRNERLAFDVVLGTDSAFESIVRVPALHVAEHLRPCPTPVGKAVVLLDGKHGGR